VAKVKLVEARVRVRTFDEAQRIIDRNIKAGKKKGAQIGVAVGGGAGGVAAGIAAGVLAGFVVGFAGGPVGAIFGGIAGGAAGGVVGGGLAGAGLGALAGSAKGGSDGYKAATIEIQEQLLRRQAEDQGETTLVEAEEVGELQDLQDPVEYMAQPSYPEDGENVERREVPSEEELRQITINVSSDDDVVYT